MCHHFQKRIVPFLSQVLMPLVQTIFTVLNAPVDPDDQVTLAEKAMLRRAYFAFLHGLVLNEVTQILANQSK